MIRFSVAGKGYDRGLAHGRQFAALIREHVCQYQLAPEWGAERGRILDAIHHNMAREVPDLLDEIRGIAKGADLPFRDLLGLNFWIEVLQATTGFGCSLIGFSGIQDGSIVGKNSDHDLAAVRYLAQQVVEGEENGVGFTFLRGTFVGTTSTRAGVNSAGLALCGAALIPVETNWDGVPIMVTIDQMLRRCGSVDEAIEMARRLPPINYGANIMVADREGRLALIQRLPLQLKVRRPTDGVLFNTNHPLSSALLSKVNQEASLMASSQQRYRKLERLVPRVPRTPSGIMQVLRDHAEPGAICQHGSTGWFTCASYLLVPAQRRMLVAEGSPCAVPYEEERLDCD